MSSIVNWSNPRLQERRVKGKTRRVNVYEVACPQCGCERWLTASDARKAERKDASCHHCSQVAKAKLGYQATAAKHGEDFALNAVQAYRLSNPSPLEAQVASILERMGVRYEREVRCGRYLIDFVANERAIEVNGRVHQLHAERDARKADTLRQAGYELLVLNQRDMHNANQILGQFLGVQHV